VQGLHPFFIKPPLYCLLPRHSSQQLKQIAVVVEADEAANSSEWTNHNFWNLIKSKLFCFLQGLGSE
jgi:hypothetical protein